MKNQTVSILISAYNHEKFIQDTIMSMIDQTYKNLELIIIDDGSADNTFSKMMEMKDLCEKRFSKVVFLTQENVGAAITTNKIIKYASGKYCCLVASDDILKKNAIETMYNFLEAHPDYLFCVGDNDFINDKNEPVCIDDSHTYTIASENAQFKFKTLIEYASNRLKNYGNFLHGRYNRAELDYVAYSDLWCDCLTPVGSLVRKSALEDILPYSVNCPEEDLYLLYQLAKKGKIKVLKECLLSYRMHDNNQMKNTNRIILNCRITNFYEMYLIDTKYPDFVFEKESEWLKQHKDIWNICKKSKYWDEKYYTDKYPDVKEKGFIPLVHYLSYGIEEGRIPSKKFSKKKIKKGENLLLKKTYIQKIAYKIYKHIKKHLINKISSKKELSFLDNIQYNILKYLCQHVYPSSQEMSNEIQEYMRQTRKKSDDRSWQAQD